MFVLFEQLPKTRFGTLDDVRHLRNTRQKHWVINKSLILLPDFIHAELTWRLYVNLLFSHRAPNFEVLYLPNPCPFLQLNSSRAFLAFRNASRSRRAVNTTLFITDLIYHKRLRQFAWAFRLLVCFFQACHPVIQLVLMHIRRAFAFFDLLGFQWGIKNREHLVASIALSLSRFI